MTENAFVSLLNDLDSYRNRNRIVLMTWFSTSVMHETSLNLISRGDDYQHGSLCWLHSVAQESKLLSPLSCRVVTHQRISRDIAFSVQFSPMLKVKIHFVPVSFADLMNVCFAVAALLVADIFSCNCRHKDI